MSLPPELIETARLLAQEPANKQHAANLIQQLQQQGLSFTLDQKTILCVRPKEALTEELTGLIKSYRPALIDALRLPALDMADSRRYFSERMRAIDMRRQGQAYCGICLFYNSLDTNKGRCLHIKVIKACENQRQYKDYCSEFLPIQP